MQVYFELLVTRVSTTRADHRICSLFLICDQKLQELGQIQYCERRHKKVRNNVYKWYWYVDIMFSFFL